MKYLESNLRNQIGDESLNNSCISFLEKYLLRKVSPDVVLDRFHAMKLRRQYVSCIAFSFFIMFFVNTNEI